jgi:hypothetical protein
MNQEHHIKEPTQNQTGTKASLSGTQLKKHLTFKSPSTRTHIVLLSMFFAIALLLTAMAWKMDVNHIDAAMRQTVHKSIFLPYWRTNPERNRLEVYAVPTEETFTANLLSKLNIPQGKQERILITRLAYDIIPGHIDEDTIANKITHDLRSLQKGEKTSVSAQAKVLPASLADAFETTLTYGLLLVSWSFWNMIAYAFTFFLLPGLALTIMSKKVSYSYIALTLALLIILTTTWMKGDSPTGDRWIAAKNQVYELSP